MKKMIKRILLKIKNGSNVKLGHRVDVTLDSKFGGNNAIDKNSSFQGDIGYGSYIGANCFLKAKIGSFTSISDNVSVVDGKHPTRDFVSTSPVFYARNHYSLKCFVDKDLFDEQSFAIPEKKISVIIGNDVWIGKNVLLMQGIKIGDGAVIGAGALVTKDIPPYAIVGGIPAKIIRYRFDEKDIDYLLKLKWWDKPLSWIKENAGFFSDIKSLKNVITID